MRRRRGFSFPHVLVFGFAVLLAACSPTPTAAPTESLAAPARETPTMTVEPAKELAAAPSPTQKAPASCAGLEFSQLEFSESAGKNPCVIDKINLIAGGKVLALLARFSGEIAASQWIYYDAESLDLLPDWTGQPGDFDHWSPQWSPDGKYAAYRRSTGEIRVIQVVGGQEVLSLPPSEKLKTSFEDGAVFVWANDHVLLRLIPGSIEAWDVATGAKAWDAPADELKMGNPGAASPAFTGMLAWSPDGALLASEGGHYHPEIPKTLNIWETKTGKLQSSFKRSNDINIQLAWAPDNQVLAIADIAQGLTLLRLPEKFVRVKGLQAPAAFAWSPDPSAPRLAVLASGDSDGEMNLWLVDSSGKAEIKQRIPFSAEQLSWFASGEQLLIIGVSQPGNTWEIWKYDVNSGDFRAIQTRQ